MNSLKLYEIEPVGLPTMHIAARSNQQAAEMYVAWQAANDLSGCAFSVEAVAMAGFAPVERFQLQTLLSSASEGIACRQQDVGWSIDSEGWSSFTADEMEDGGLRIFEMADTTQIKAFVLAANYERAAEIFQTHLGVCGGDPDTQFWRPRSADQLGDVEQSVVRQALGLEVEGLLTCDALGHWSFATPLG